MKTSHPNRLNKQRGDKLSSWSHNCKPNTDKEKLEIIQQLDDKEKPNKKSQAKKKEYSVWVLWGRNYNLLNEKSKWWRHGKYLKLSDAEKSFDKLKNSHASFKDKDGNLVYYYKAIKLTFKDKTIKEFYR